MTEQAALLAAIVADADDDTTRLAYADWLDENRPDRVPSPASGPSARAEFIRVQCRLAAGAFADADYPRLLEREADLATWLNTHDPDDDPGLGGLCYGGEFEGGEWGDYRRGFLEVVEFEDYGDDAAANVDRIAEALDDAFAGYAGRTLLLKDPLEEEIVRLARRPVFGRLRGLYLDGLGEGDEDGAVAAIARSPRSVGLRRLYFDFPLGGKGCEALAGSPHLGNLEALVLDYPSLGAAQIKTLGRSKWFRNLRRLHLWLGRGDSLRALAGLPPMPRLVSLTLRGAADGSPAVLRRFAASGAFPRLTHLDLGDARLEGDHVALLARGQWPLRHLQLGQNEIRKSGAEAKIGRAHV